MCGRGRVAGARGVKEMAADIVHLDAEQVAESVRKKRRGDASFDQAVAAAARQIKLLEQIGRVAMTTDVQINIGLPGVNAGDQRTLLFVECLDQIGKQAGIFAVAARDVGRVAVAAGAGVDEKTQ